MYRCLNCKKDIESDDVARRITCPYCGYRIIIKTKNPAVIATVKAR